MTRPKVKSGEHELLPGVKAGDRRALARAITLVESTKSEDRAEAEVLLSQLLPLSGGSVRLGISGAPGAGKSTFIEAFGKHLTGQGLKVGVLAIDPTSRRSGGSILGDKTRMEALSRDPGAFIRPSPAGITLGGVARRTREAMLVLEAAGFDVVIVETVGVGQSETEVAEMVDVFVLLLSPGGGDDLQGIKRGVMELADILLVTKADGDLEQAAGRAASDYHAAMHLMRPKYPGLTAQVLKVSAMKGTGIAEAWAAMRDFQEGLKASGSLARLRAEQARRWFWSEVQAAVADEVAEDGQAAQVEADVAAGKVLPHAAARALIRRFRHA